MRTIVIAVCILAGGLVLARPSDDSLAAMRQAMGGDALLGSIRTLGIEASETSREGGGSYSLEARIALPDKFVRIVRSYFDAGPAGEQTVTSTYGFNGRELIAFIDNTMGAALPAYPGMAAVTTDQQTALTRKHYDDERRKMLEWTIPLLGGANSDPGFTAAASREDTADGRVVKIVDLTRWDGSQARLTIDAATNLPMRLAWMAPPPEKWMMTSSLGVAVSRGGQTSQPASASPVTTSGRSGGAGPDVEHAIAMDQFKTEKGLTWPRRFATSIGGTPYHETKISKFAINPKFPDDAFRSR